VDFGVTEHQHAGDADMNWMKEYHDLSETLQWDPECTDVCIELSNDNRKAERVGVSTLFPKTIADRPISMKRRRIIRLDANRSGFVLGFICAPSKEDLHREANVSYQGRKLTEMLERRDLGGSIMYDVISSCYEKKTGCNEKVKTTDMKNKSTPCDIRLRIEPAKHKIFWEIDGAVQWESLIPSPEPVFLVYSNSHSKASMELLAPGMVAQPSKKKKKDK